MGKVFVAEDTKLHRKVALKVLPAETASSAHRLARFQREAHAVAALNHPHIVTLFSVEETAGTHFLTMELVEGASLDQALAAGGLPLAKIFHVGMALADALAAAHEKGIVHRDLKPANVMLTKDERVKVLDFGLAKLGGGTAEAITETVPRDGSLTAPGAVVGTVPYMSPEQVSGETVDARTDVFSLGVVLYEMTTGRRPFQGKNHAETISSILRDAPRPVAESRQDAPRHLSRIIDHCLQKDPRDRYQTARDVLNELRALRDEIESRASVAPNHGAAPPPSGSGATAGSDGSGRWAWAVAGIAAVAVAGLVLFQVRGGRPAPQPPAAAAIPAESPVTAPDPRSIAVLSFVNMNEDEASEYFSDGIAEELLNLLSKVPGLKVTARTSSFSFKGKDTDITEIGRRLNVATILEGSVRKEDDRVRITVQLISAADGYHIWSETYDRQLDSIFAVQDDITRSVTSLLGATLAAFNDVGLRTRSTEAYGLLLRARYHYSRWGPGDLQRANDLYKQVLALEADNAAAWMGLAWSYLNMVETGRLDPEEGNRLARDATEHALALDESLGMAHAQAGFQRLNEWDWPGAEAELEKALALEPRNLACLNLAAFLATVQDRLHDASEFYRQCRELDPLSTWVLNNSAATLLSEGRLDEALAIARMVLELNAQREGAHALVGSVLLAQGKPDAALQEVLQEEGSRARLYGLVKIYQALGRKAESDAAFAEYVQLKDTYNIACLHALRGEPDEAFEWLDRAYAERDRGLMWLKSDSDLVSLRGDPRWLPLLRKMRLTT